MFALPQSEGQAPETWADIPLWALLQTSAFKGSSRWWLDFINSMDETFLCELVSLTDAAPQLCWNYKFLQPHYHFKLNQRITEMHIFMRILWGKNITLKLITNQRAALDLCRASRECIFLGIGLKIKKRHNTLYKPSTKVLMHTRASPPGLDFFDPFQQSALGPCVI